MNYRAAFGDGEYSFTITTHLIPELEHVTGAGIGTLCQRLFAGQFRHADIAETIRLGLIGGGTAPDAAKRLTDTYLPVMPLGEPMRSLSPSLSAFGLAHPSPTNPNKSEAA